MLALFERAYQKQSASLSKVQEIGPALEKEIKARLKWSCGRLVYYKNNGLTYDIQVDACYPSVKKPEAFVSVTYCNPDTPGHSNENKLQLKLGELMLFKARYPKIKGILVIGGTKEAWLSYVIQAFQYFFDEVLCTWDSNFEKRISALAADPGVVPRKHEEIWKRLSREWAETKLCLDEPPIDSYLRENAWEYMCRHGCEGDVPSKIGNEIIRSCMQAAYDCSVATRARSGVEWQHYMNGRWSKLWQSRSFFNPAEAAIELVLMKSGYAYLGGVAVDVEVPSLIHYLGGTDVDNTKVSEDFVLYSRKYDMPVFIQSKATGGGKKRHGKNIQNRTKEQIARSLFYRGYIQNGQIKLRDKDYIWLSVLDGNWGVTKKTPWKYMHMLQWAGYDYLIAADSLVDEQMNITLPNPLSEVLEDLDCVRKKGNLRTFGSDGSTTAHKEGGARTVLLFYVFSNITMDSRTGIRPYLRICCGLFPFIRATTIFFAASPYCSAIRQIR